MRVSNGGRELDATFSVEGQAGAWELVFEARGGTRGTPGAVNTEYHTGLEVLLARLRQLGATIASVEVDSRDTQRKGLTREQRRLRLARQPYPFNLEPAMDLHELRLNICRAQGHIGRAPAAKGYGNGTKRIRLFLRLPEAFAPDRRGLEEVLAFGVADGGASPPHPAPHLPQEDLREPQAEEEEVIERALENIEGRETRSGGQGYARSRALRVAVELHAMKFVTHHYEEAGWAVKDVSARESWDLLCTRPGEPELHVEVKGTMSDGEKVFLTRNEVEHARQRFPQVELAVVTRINITWVGERPVASGGSLWVHSPWVVEDAALSPIAYEYRPPASPSN